MTWNNQELCNAVDGKDFPISHCLATQNTKCVSRASSQRTTTAAAMTANANFNFHGWQNDQSCRKRNESSKLKQHQSEKWHSKNVNTLNVQSGAAVEESHNITVSPPGGLESHFQPIWGGKHWFINLMCGAVVSKTDFLKSNTRETNKWGYSLNLSKFWKDFKTERPFFTHNKDTSKKCHFSFQSPLNPSLCSRSLRIISSTSAAKFGQISLTLAL